MKREKRDVIVNPYSMFVSLFLHDNDMLLFNLLYFYLVLSNLPRDSVHYKNIVNL